MSKTENMLSFMQTVFLFFPVTNQVFVTTALVFLILRFRHSQHFVKVRERLWSGLIQPKCFVA